MALVAALNGRAMPSWAQAATGKDVPAGDRPADVAPPFDFQRLRELAAALAAGSYAPPTPELPEVLDKLTYEQYRAIRFRPEQALWRDIPAPFHLQLYHPGWIFKPPVRVNVVADGRPRTVPFSKQMFEYGAGTPEIGDLSTDLGFAGFRINAPVDDADTFEEMAIFRGASYFRSRGRNQHYGITARGLAIDTAVRSGEEFPRFREFWIEQPSPKDGAIQLYALLESPSMAGAYRFRIAPGAITIMNVTCHLFPRQPVEKLGLAPLTSMFLFGENDRSQFDDVRPEVHDSDGLLMASSEGEWIWRPLINPARLRLSSFAHTNPRGFGLLQRDRTFANYQDLEAQYQRRPDVWVEPVGEWGKGVVHLVEIPTTEDIHDNIVAFWWPEQPLEPGNEARFEYNLYWGADLPPCRTTAATVLGTWLGTAKDAAQRKIVIDFVGGELPDIEDGAAVQPVVTASAGKLSQPIAERNVITSGWRVSFQLDPQGSELIEMRCFLRLGEKALSETWTYQWTSG